MTIRARAALLLLGIVMVLGSVVPSLAQGLPDLVIDEARVQSSAFFQMKNFNKNDCAWVEGLLAGLGRRALLRFDVSAANLGTADVFLGAPSAHPDLFTYSPCHGHYHFSGYASYELLDATGTVVVIGRKQAFCLEDFELVSAGAGNAKYTCGYQGISVGWADTYGSFLDGQWLDVTGFPSGNYTLRVTINPCHFPGVSSGCSQATIDAMPESNYGNNTALVPVFIPARIR